MGIESSRISRFLLELRQTKYQNFLDTFNIVSYLDKGRDAGKLLGKGD
jgi:hypothetical protein